MNIIIVFNNSQNSQQVFNNQHVKLILTKKMHTYFFSVLIEPRQDGIVPRRRVSKIQAD
jgi:hypothetical protein